MRGGRRRRRRLPRGKVSSNFFSGSTTLPGSGSTMLNGGVTSVSGIGVGIMQRPSYSTVAPLCTTEHTELAYLCCV